MTTPARMPYMMDVGPYPMALVTMGVNAMLMIMATNWKAWRRALVFARLASSRNSSGNNAP
jgi:hypothetical protein